jgi:hypothetical protein
MTSPNPGAYNNGATTVGTTPTLIAVTADCGTGGVLVQNNGTATVYLGGPSVAASGANLGISLAQGTTPLLVPTVGGPADGLYAVTASSSATVVVLFASGA